MEHKTLYDLLKTLQIPVAYDHFNSDKNVNPPYVVYREIAPDTFKAEDITYFRPYNYEIQLVTSIKNPTLEQTIENLFTTNKIPYDKNDEIWDDDEKIYRNFYEI